jgi:hypothetical protein
MGNYYDEMPDDPKLVEWILNQKLFHVASAPLKGELHLRSLSCVSSNLSFRLYRYPGGHVNVSPKGYQTFKLVNSKACWYLDLSGSGAPILAGVSNWDSQSPY